MASPLPVQLVRDAKTKPGKPLTGSCKVLSSADGGGRAEALQQLSWSLTADGRLSVRAEGRLEAVGGWAYVVARTYAHAATRESARNERRPVVAVVEALGLTSSQQRDAHVLFSTMDRSALGAEHLGRHVLQQVPDWVQLVPKTGKVPKGWGKWAAGAVDEAVRDSGGALLGVRTRMVRGGKVMVKGGYADVHWRSSRALEVEGGRVLLGVSQLLESRLGHVIDQIGFRTVLLNGEILVPVGPWTSDAQTREILEW